MCYSKEVSLAVGGFMAASCAATWAWQVRPAPPAVRGFQADVLRGLLCVAGHQGFEFLAIASGDPRVYKVGLLCSISCMLFLTRAVERLTRSPRRVETGAVAVSIAALAAHLAAADMRFENCHFWVRGWSHTAWSVVWLTFFVYWNLRLREAARRSGSPANARLLRRAGWAVLNASFALSVLYVYGSAVAATLARGGATWGGATWGGAIWDRLARTVLVSRDVYGDAPSVWCVFAALQCLLVPPFFAALRRGWEPEAPFAPPTLTRSRRLQMLLATALGVWGLCHLHPVVVAAAKMVTR